MCVVLSGDDARAEAMARSAAVVGNLSERGRPSDYIGCNTGALEACGVEEPPLVVCVHGAGKFRDYTISHDTVLDPGSRLDTLVEELQRAVAVVCSVPQVAIQGGLRGKTDFALRVVAAESAGRAEREARIFEATPEMNASISEREAFEKKVRALNLHVSLSRRAR